MKPCAQTKLMKHICAEDWVSTLFRIHNHPKEAKRWVKMQSDGHTFSEQLPLHQACASCPPVEVIKALLVAYPESCSKKDSFFRRNALHIATIYGASIEVIKLLVAWDKTMARETDKLHRLPLHYALFSSLTPQAIQILLDVYPEAAQVQDYKGWLALHVGARQCAASEIMTSLIEAYPASMKVTTVSGMTAQDISEKIASHILEANVLSCEEPPTEICIPQAIEVEKLPQPSLDKPWTCFGLYLAGDTS